MTWVSGSSIRSVSVATDSAALAAAYPPDSGHGVTGASEVTLTITGGVSAPISASGPNS